LIAAEAFKSMAALLGRATELGNGTRKALVKLKWPMLDGLKQW
jgi:hypothetical protein